MRVVPDPRSFPSYDTFWHIFDWSKFENDERTKDLVAYWGCNFDTSKLDHKKINAYMGIEHPGIFFVGRIPGTNLANQLRMENSFDHLLTYNFQVANSGRGYRFIPYPYDIEFVHRQLGISSIDDVEKNLDVVLCGTNPAPDRPITPWANAIKQFDHSFCSPHPPGVFKSWNEKQWDIARSKIMIMWSVFFGADEASKNFSESNFPWIKFDRGPDLSRWLTPHFKPRAHEAASLKSLMLCYKGPFAGKDYPYNNSIEYYYEPDVDFLYFEDAKDLQDKIRMILDDYDNPRYKNMVDSAYNKVASDHTIEAWYEEYMVPLAIEGKTR
jgi:hypothetical protein